MVVVIDDMMVEEETDFDSSILPTPINATSSSSSSSSSSDSGNNDTGDEGINNNNGDDANDFKNKVVKIPNTLTESKTDIQVIRSKHMKRKRYKRTPYSRNKVQPIPNDFERSNGINIEINSTVHKTSDNGNQMDSSINDLKKNNCGNTNNSIHNLLNLLSYAKYPANFYTTYMILSQLSNLSTFGGLGTIATTPMVTTLASGLLSSVTTFFTSKILQKRI